MAWSICWGNRAPSTEISKPQTCLTACGREGVSAAGQAAPRSRQGETSGREGVSAAERAAPRAGRGRPGSTPVATGPVTGSPAETELAESGGRSLAQTTEDWRGWVLSRVKADQR